MNGDSYVSTRDAGRSREHYSSRHDRDDRRDRDRGDRGDRGERGERGDRPDRGDRRERERERDRGERRRSRSPHHRPRREHDDTYASSRDYRAREREDRYGGRRDDRAWDRDRGPRRRDDERPPRRDRDLFEDRRGGGGAGGGGRDRGGREDRDEFAQQAQAQGRKGGSPPPKKREPTPDLTDIVSVLERKRRLKQWDIKPPGYENVTGEQAKLSGMFPLPGAPRQQMDPSRLQAFINQPQGEVDNTALKTSNARQSKRLFLYNVPNSATEESIMSFFNLQLNGLNVSHGSNPCISVHLAKDRGFALLEFKSPDDTTVALALDGITMEEHITEANGSANGSVRGLDIKRPKDYIVPQPDAEAYNTIGEFSSEVPDSENKLSISNIDPELTDDQIVELVKTFGDLKAFVLVKDNSTQESRGIAFVEFQDPASTSIALEGLNGMEVRDRILKVTMASIGFKQASGMEMGVNAMSMFAGTTSNDFEEGRVLQLLNMVTAEELIDNEDYEEICEDVQEECQKYGQILEMKIPRPAGGSRQSAGVGKIFIKYVDAAAAKKALQALAGRKFADRTVVTTYFDEASFEVGAW